jgi:hypothetical protein
LISAPQITNLPAIIWPLKPELSVEDVRKVIENQATREGNKPPRVIAPATLNSG